MADLNKIMSINSVGKEVSYDDHATMLYALSVGMGRSQTAPEELLYVYEGMGFRALPTIATCLMAPPVPDAGLNMSKVLHGEQRLKFSNPLPAQGTLIVDNRVASVIDKGNDRGALVNFLSVAKTGDGQPLFEGTTSIFARGDGGIGSFGDAPEPLPPVPDRAPDHIIVEETRLDQALLYRLNEDRNPLHADPEVARKAGFDRPILHGLCSYGIVCKALTLILPDESDWISQMDVRFKAPVLPGDDLKIEVWEIQKNFAFRVSVEDRQTIVLDNGFCAVSSAT